MTAEAAAVGVRVLLVDDNDELRGLYRIALETNPDLKVVGEASNGQEGITAAMSLRPDVTLLDLSMPTMDGLEALTHIRRAHPPGHVLILTGFKRERLEDVARELGATGFIEKGILPTALATEVARVAATPAPEFLAPGEARRRELAARATELI